MAEVRGKGRRLEVGGGPQQIKIVAITDLLTKFFCGNQN